MNYDKTDKSVHTHIKSIYVDKKDESIQNGTFVTNVMNAYKSRKSDKPI